MIIGDDAQREQTEAWEREQAEKRIAWLMLKRGLGYRDARDQVDRESFRAAWGENVDDA